VNGAEVTPSGLVGTTIVAVEFLNVPLAPLLGAVKVTFTPDTRLPPASFTVTAKGLVNAVLIAADCGVVSEFTVIAGSGGKLLGGPRSP